MKKIFSIILIALLALPMAAQVKRSDDFHSKYKLKEAVVLSRHNIRSPLSGRGSTLGDLTPHEWVKWSAAPSELTKRGGACETLMGQFFGDWLIGEGLFPANYVPTADEVEVYANSMQRCIATAQYFTSGFMPVANLRVNHKYSPSKMDPVFNPCLTKASPEFVEEAQKQIAAMGGEGGVVAYNEAIAPNYALIEEVIDAKTSPAAKAGKFKGFNDYNCKVKLEKGKEPSFASGSLKDACSVSDALTLQYYEEPDSLKAGFGHPLTRQQWKQIAEVKDAYQDMLFCAPIVAANVAHPLIEYMHDELNSDARKFCLLVGHDSNIGSVAAALGIEVKDLPNAIEAQTPIGGKMVFEKWEGPDGKEYVAVNMVYQTVDQLRDPSLLLVENAPMVVPVPITGLTPNADGLYSLDDINARFQQALAAYEAIPY
ncbi:MAG: histidine-type phosphatase [Bacteroidales bacterium]|nr:histidine-type phosphatase [Bacteroidales bacterium]